jgi:hypothetical protein
MTAYTYRDRAHNLWVVDIAAPAREPIHAHDRIWGWRVTVQWVTGGVTTHQHPNLAEAMAEAVNKR